MTFSIVIPAYNGAKFLEETILSVLGQERKADEIIVHDDNSTDLTKQICKKYSQYLSYFLNKKGPSGFVDGWNKAISLAQYEFIIVLHQDDLLYPPFLQEVEEVLMQKPGIRHLFTLCDYISDQSDVINAGEKAVSKDYNIGDIVLFNGRDYVKAYQKSYYGLPHIHRCPGVVTHRSIFEAGCIYNPDAGHIADDDFFYRVGQLTNVVGIIKSFAAFRIHTDSETGSLGGVNLVKRLAVDYIFQVKQWQNSEFLYGSERRYFEYWANRYVLKILHYAFKNNDKELRQYGYVLKKELDNLNLYSKFNLDRLKGILMQFLIRFM
jgi:glycosyltransferase involved in cell wall biosynthesis